MYFDVLEFKTIACFNILKIDFLHMRMYRVL